MKDWKDIPANAVITIDVALGRTLIISRDAWNQMLPRYLGCDGGLMCFKCGMLCAVAEGVILDIDM